MKRLSFLYFQFYVLLFGHLTVGLAQSNVGTIDSLESQLQTDLPDSSRIKLLNKLTNLITNKNIKRADSLSSHALVLATKLNNSQWLADAFYNKAIILHISGKYDSAEFFYEKVSPLRQVLNDSLGWAGVLNNLAALYSVRGLYPKALAYYLQSLSIKEKLKVSRGLGNTLNNIGNIYYYQKNYEKARKYYEQSLIIESEQQNGMGRARSLGNLGLLHLEEMTYDSAKYYYLKAYSLVTALDLSCQKMYSANGLGQAYFHLNRYDSSKILLKEALEEATQCQDPVIISASLEVMAKIFWKEKEYRQAFNLLNKSLAIAVENQLKASIRDVSKTLYQLHNERKEYAQALKYLEMHMHFTDSLENEAMKEKLTQMEMEFDFQKEKDSLFYEQEKVTIFYNSELKRREILQRSTWLILVLLGLLLSVLYLYYRQKVRSSKRQEMVNKELRKLLDRNNLLMREIHHRVKNNLQLMTSLLNIQLRLVTQPKTRSIIIDSQNRIQTMALVHHSLYSENDSSEICLDEYLNDLLPKVLKSLATQKHVDFSLTSNPTSLRVPPDMGMNFGLIFNELITNSIKHAGAEELLKVKISLEQIENKLKLSYQDNGRGIESTNQEINFGSLLVESLIQSMKGTFSVQSGLNYKLIINVDL